MVSESYRVTSPLSPSTGSRQQGGCPPLLAPTAEPSGRWLKGLPCHSWKSQMSRVCGVPHHVNTPLLWFRAGSEVAYLETLLCLPRSMNENQQA